MRRCWRIGTRASTSMKPTGGWLASPGRPCSATACGRRSDTDLALPLPRSFTNAEISEPVRLYRGACMQITRTTDYGVRVLTHLAMLPAGTRLTAAELAGESHASMTFVAKILQRLVASRLVNSHR